MEFWEQVRTDCNLGAFLMPPQRITGGYLHRMYRLDTERGSYAVKLLNPNIMARPDAKQNFDRAEYLERVLAEQGIPVISALEWNGRKRQCAEGQYYYVFPWSDGKAIPWQDIQVRHCLEAGRLLASIHRIPCKEQLGKQPGQGRPLIEISWEPYQKLAGQNCPELAELLRRHGGLLSDAQRAYNQAIEQAPEAASICDGDMDCKNVLWIEGKPAVIDLECLDYGNPWIEAFGLALSWAGGAVCELDYDRLQVFLQAYEENIEGFMAGQDCLPTSKMDWRNLYGVGFSWLDWLEYNVKRALGLECQDEEEQRLGLAEAKETLKRMVYYDSIREELIKKLGEMRKG